MPNVCHQQVERRYTPAQKSPAWSPVCIPKGGNLQQVAPTAASMAEDRGPLDDVRLMSTGLDKIAIKNTVALLPPSPGNTLSEFLTGVVSGAIQPAMCYSEPRIDPARYWEKRRVQSSLRRLLEALQERLSVEREALQDVGGQAYDELMDLLQHRQLGMGARGCCELDEDAFVWAVEQLAAWPPEMSAADRSEIFTAMRAPSSVAVRALSTGQPLPMHLSRRMFCEGLARVPYNIPDYPVPAHLFHGKGSHSVAEVAQNVAAVFSREQTGLERVKDFFLCGLLSLEEIQVALPELVPISLLEKAIQEIVSIGAEHLTQRERQTLVVSVQVVPSKKEHSSLPLRDIEPLPSLASPCSDYRHTSDSTVPAGRERDSPVRGKLFEEFSQQEDADGRHLQLPSSTSRARHAQKQAAEHAHRLNGDFPLCPAEAGAAEAYAQGAEENPRCRALHRVINWGTTRWSSAGSGGPGPGDGGLRTSGSAADPGHQADEGAGTWTSFQQGSSAITAPMNPVCMSMAHCDDPLRMVNMDMHSENSGPYLALAFVRCCQRYEARLGEPQQDR